MIGKIIQRECYIPHAQIKDNIVDTNKYTNLDTIYIENIFNNDFDFPGPCIDDFSSRNCPNTRIVVYKNIDISNNSCKDHFNRRIIYSDKYELYRKLERSFQKKRISIKRWIQKKEKRFLTVNSTMICYPDNDHKYKVNITGGIICYKCFKNFVNYFIKHDLVILFVSKITTDSTEFSTNTIIIKLTKPEIEQFITKYYCNREYFNSYHSVRIIVNISDGIEIPINLKKVLYLLYQYVDVKRRFTWFYYNNTPSYHDLTRIECILPFIVSPLYYPLTVSTYNLLVKVIGNFIPHNRLHSPSVTNCNKIHYVSLTKHEKMNLVQYKTSGIGLMNTNFSLRKYEVQDFCGKIKKDRLCLPHMIYNKGELLRKLSTQKECPICLQDIKEFGITVCGHIFCYECISLCIKQGLCCPHCRNKKINYQNTFKVVKNKPDTVVFQLTEYQSSYLRYYIGSKLCFLLRLLENISNPVIIVSDYDTTLEKISDLFDNLQISYESVLDHSKQFQYSISHGEQLYQYYLTSSDLINTEVQIIFMENTIYSKWFLNNSQRYSTKCKIHLLDLMVN